jgi:hypothetical protein
MPNQVVDCPIVQITKMTNLALSADDARGAPLINVNLRLVDCTNSWIPALNSQGKPEQLLMLSEGSSGKPKS